MSDTLSIREASGRDVEFISSVLFLVYEDEEAKHPDWDAEKFKEIVQARTRDEVDGKEENSTTYVVCYQDVQVGRLRVVRTDDSIHVAGIQILPEHQRKGIGSKVLSVVINEANDKALPVTLEVGKDNPEAKRLYLRLGFQVIQDHGEQELMSL